MKIRRWLRSTALIAVGCGIYGLVWAGEPRTSGTESKEKSEKARKAPTTPQLNWVEYGEALKQAESEDKHVLIDFYTNWCGWCKVMDRKTYADQRVIELLNTNFVIAKVNAESPATFKVGEQQVSGRDLARQFGVQSFPMTWFLKPDGSRLVNIPGYMPPERFLKALEYVHNRSYDRQSE